MKFLSLALLLLFSNYAEAVGTITASREYVGYSKAAIAKRVEVVTVDWVADAALDTVPALSIDLRGYVAKVITNPGSVAPVDNWDIAVFDPADGALDALTSTLLNRDTANTEQVIPVISGSVQPIFLAGTYSLAVTNVNVASSTGRIIFYLVDAP